MKILMLDTDLDYAQRFKYYFGKKYTDIHVSLCDNYEAVKKLLNEDTYDVILFDASFDHIEVKSLDALTAGAVFAYVSGTNEIINEKETLYKYQGMSEFYAKICGLYEKKKNRIVRQSDGNAKDGDIREVITFLPVHGGAGASTMAAACAVSLGADCSVLYINLEQCPSDSAFFKNDSKKGITDVVSALKTKYTEAGIYQLLKDVIRKDQNQKGANVSYIRGYNNIMDCTAMSEHCIEVMIKVLRAKFDFRYIFIDADYIVGPVLQKLIVSSDKLVLVSSGSDIANIKLAKIQRYLDVLKRDEANTMPENYLVFNQYYGMRNEAAVARNMHVVARFARYRTDDKTRITSQKIIEEIRAKKGAFAVLTEVYEEQSK